MDLLKLESIIKTQLNVKVPHLIGDKYPNMSFTTEISDKTPSFPNVYVHEMDSTELGQDLDNQRLHAVRATFQIEVTTNTTKADARTVTNACVSVLKSLRFSVPTMPIYTKINNVHRFVFRVRRIIASGDDL